MQDHIIQFSMDDVIDILESAPVRPDMIGEITIAQVMNRAPLAHLSIERALKFLIRKQGLDFKEDHNLHTHLETLRRCSPRTAEYLDQAFDVAVSFYGLNPNRIEFKHLRSLDAYLSMVGTANAFDTMRYWELDQAPDPLAGRIWLSIHLEILRALREVYLYEDVTAAETVADRVERAVLDALTQADHLAYVPGSAKETDVKEYLAWLQKHPSFKDSLAHAIKSGFHIGNQIMNQVAAQAYETLRRSQDPAVRYLTIRLDVLPRQPRDATPPVEWLDAQGERSGIVKTPSGHNLGFIDRGPDGIWHITPSRNGPVRVAARAETQTDARCYLAQLLTGRVTLTVDGSQYDARLIGEKYRKIQRNHRWHEADAVVTTQDDEWSHKLEFWDTHHGIQVGHQIRVEAIIDDSDNIARVLEGQVSGVEGHVVHVVGHDYLDLATPSERADNEQADDNHMR